MDKQNIVNIGNLDRFYKRLQKDFAKKEDSIGYDENFTLGGKVFVDGEVVGDTLILSKGKVVNDTLYL